MLPLVLVALVSLLTGSGWALAAPQAAPPVMAAPDDELAADDTASADDEVVLPTEHPFLWRIDGDPPSWLYGTMHVADPRVTTLPDVVTEAFEGSDALYVEIPFDMQSMSKVTQGTFLPHGRRLSDLLPAATYERLAAHLEERGMPMALFDRMQPWAVSSTLGMLGGDTPGGVPLDMALWGRAGELGLDRGSLETPEEQLALFNDVGLDEQVRMIEKTLDQIEEAESSGISVIESLTLAYLAGDEDALLRFFEEEMPSEDEDAEAAAASHRFMRALLVDRNMFMLDGVLRLLDERPDQSFFFAVGAAHHVGPFGLVKLLESEGFRVTRIQAPIPAETVGAP